MKSEIKNRELRERQAYVPASVKVITTTVQRVICASNEQYSNENYNPWA